MTTLFLLVWSTIAIVLAAWLGLKFPDIDQRTDLLLHRSIITHGPLLPLILFLLLRNAGNTSVRQFAMFFCLGVTVHLAFDLFPANWTGYALVSLPVLGWLPAWISIIWIGGSLLVSAFWAFRLIQDLWQVLVAILGTAAIFVYAAPGESALLGPAIVVVVSIVLAAAASLLQEFLKSE